MWSWVQHWCSFVQSFFHHTVLLDISLKINICTWLVRYLLALLETYSQNSFLQVSNTAVNQFCRSRWCSTRKVIALDQSGLQAWKCTENNLSAKRNIFENRKQFIYLPLVIASRAHPAPVAPPPMIITSYSSPLWSVFTCSDRGGNFRLTRGVAMAAAFTFWLKEKSFENIYVNSTTFDPIEWYIWMIVLYIVCRMGLRPIQRVPNQRMHQVSSRRSYESMPPFRFTDYLKNATDEYKVKFLRINFTVIVTSYKASFQSTFVMSTMYLKKI